MLNVRLNKGVPVVVPIFYIDKPWVDRIAGEQPLGPGAVERDSLLLMARAENNNQFTISQINQTLLFRPLSYRQRIDQCCPAMGVLRLLVGEAGSLKAFRDPVSLFLQSINLSSQESILDW